MVIRGELGASSIIKLHVGPHCCNDTGATLKVLDNLDIVSGDVYKTSLDSLKNMLRECIHSFDKESIAMISDAEGEYGLLRANGNI